MERNCVCESVTVNYLTARAEGLQSLSLSNDVKTIKLRSPRPPSRVVHMRELWRA
jgi:hypothetical protein